MGVRFRPGAAHLIFNVDVSTITDQRVMLENLIGGEEASKIEASIARSCGLFQQRSALLDHVSQLVAAHVTPDCEAARFADTVLETLVSGPRATRQELSDATGVSVRQLHRRSLRMFGYGTATLARILRFQRLVALATTAPTTKPLAMLAADAGYSDHAHLVRDCRAITSLTPTEFIAEHFPTFPDMADPYKTSVPLVATLRR